jgi:hypothetical protein
MDTQLQKQNIWSFFQVKLDKNAMRLIFSLSQKTEIPLLPLSWVLKSTAHVCHTQNLSLGWCFKSAYLSKARAHVTCRVKYVSDEVNASLAAFTLCALMWNMSTSCF